MSDFLDIKTWSILQWILVVLAAGFIGQFGKSFAKFIMTKARPMSSAVKATATTSAPAGGPEIKPPLPAVPEGKGDLTPTAARGGRPPHDAGNAAEIVADKKALKAILKLQKKAAKASK